VALQATNVLQQVGQDVGAMNILSLSTSSGLDKHRWAVICYLHLLIFYSAAVPGLDEQLFPTCFNTQTLAATVSKTIKQR